MKPHLMLDFKIYNSMCSPVYYKTQYTIFSYAVASRFSVCTDDISLKENLNARMYRATSEGARSSKFTIF
jgi:hypothetical protein